MSSDGRRTVVLDGLPVALFDASLTYLADILRECQLILVRQGQDGAADPLLVELADHLVPDIEALRDLFGQAHISVERGRYRVELSMGLPDAETIAHLQMRLVQVRLLGRRGSLMVVSDPRVTQLLAWIWDEAADQLHDRRARPYTGP